MDERVLMPKKIKMTVTHELHEGHEYGLWHVRDQDGHEVPTGMKDAAGNEVHGYPTFELATFVAGHIEKRPDPHLAHVARKLHRMARSKIVVDEPAVEPEVPFTEEHGGHFTADHEGHPTRLWRAAVEIAKWSQTIAARAGSN